jgi:hypothetical protein
MGLAGSLASLREMNQLHQMTKYALTLCGLGCFTRIYILWDVPDDCLKIGNRHKNVILIAVNGGKMRTKGEQRRRK